mgnify:FL=1
MYHYISYMYHVCIRVAHITLYHDISYTYHTTREPYHRFKQCYAGIKPRGVKKFKDVADICSALVLVQTAVTPGSCMPCKANPYDMICLCKGGRKIGICAHILLVTHDEMSHVAIGQRKALCNLKHMATKIAGDKKKVGQPKKVKHCLVAETDDEEEDDQRLVTW